VGVCQGLIKISFLFCIVIAICHFITLLGLPVLGTFLAGFGLKWLLEQI
jgi:hypothetical protein